MDVVNSDSLCHSSKGSLTKKYRLNMKKSSERAQRPPGSAPDSFHGGDGSGRRSSSTGRHETQSMAPIGQFRSQNLHYQMPMQAAPQKLSQQRPDFTMNQKTALYQRDNRHGTMMFPTQQLHPSQSGYNYKCDMLDFDHGGPSHHASFALRSRGNYPRGGLYSRPDYVPGNNETSNVGVVGYNSGAGTSSSSPCTDNNSYMTDTFDFQ